MKRRKKRKMKHEEERERERERDVPPIIPLGDRRNLFFLFSKGTRLTLSCFQ